MYTLAFLVSQWRCTWAALTSVLTAKLAGALHERKKKALSLLASGSVICLDVSECQNLEGEETILCYYLTH